MLLNPRFPDCDQLLVAVFDEQAAAATEAVTTAILEAPTDVRPRVTAVITAGVDYLTHDPRRTAFLLESQATQFLRERRHQFLQLITTMLVGQAREVLGDRIADDRNAQLAALTVVHGIFDVTALWLRRELDVDRDQFIEFIVAIIITGSTITDAVERELTTP